MLEVQLTQFNGLISLDMTEGSVRIHVHEAENKSKLLT